ncbi:hypothetical protein M5K25_018571 [Dendrobium thyrsiflorum]|uniref:Uncharacterized protein n=1 Tax=Dendrobium thyrsiflorum TaxID=117978 RepID=A0ABD0UIL0_DENTH
MQKAKGNMASVAAKKMDALEERLEREMSQMKATVDDRISSMEGKVSYFHEMVKKILDNQNQTAASDARGPVKRNTNSEICKSENEVEIIEERSGRYGKRRGYGGMNQGVLIGKEKRGIMIGGVLIVKEEGEKVKMSMGMSVEGRIRTLGEDQTHWEGKLWRNQSKWGRFEGRTTCCPAPHKAHGRLSSSPILPTIAVQIFWTISNGYLATRKIIVCCPDLPRLLSTKLQQIFLLKCSPEDPVVLSKTARLLLQEPRIQSTCCPSPGSYQTAVPNVEIAVQNQPPAVRSVLTKEVRLLPSRAPHDCCPNANKVVCCCPPLLKALNYYTRASHPRLLWVNSSSDSFVFLVTFQLWI